MSTMKQIYDDPIEEIRFWQSFGSINNEVVYCPMCEELHENASHCQRND